MNVMGKLYISETNEFSEAFKLSLLLLFLSERESFKWVINVIHGGVINMNKFCVRHLFWFLLNEYTRKREIDKWNVSNFLFREIAICSHYSRLDTPNTRGGNFPLY